MKQRTLLLLAVMMVAIGCNDQIKFEEGQRTLAQEEAAIRAADAEWLSAVKARDVEKAISYWSDDGAIMAPDTPPVVGKKAIRDYVQGAFALPEFSITWQTDKVVVAKGGDMAYSTGTGQTVFRGNDKKLVTMNNKSMVVWRKEPNGSWKAVVDMWNAEK